MGLFDFTNGGGLFSDPNTMALMGLAQGFGQAAMPTRMPIRNGAALAMGLGGMQQGANAAQQYQSTQMANEQQRMLLNFYKQMQGGQPQESPATLVPFMGDNSQQPDPNAPQIAPGNATPGTSAPPPVAPRMPGQGPRQMGAVPFGIPQSGMDPVQMIMMGRSMLGVPTLSGTGANLIATGQKMLESGMVPDGQGGVTAIPGYLDFQASKSGATARGEAPYKIAESLASQAGKVDKLAPGEYAVTGMSTMPPEFVNLIRNAAGGTPQQSYAPQQPQPQPQAAPQQPVQQPVQSPVHAGGQPGVNASGFPVQSPRAYGGGFQNPISLEGATMQKEILPAQYQEAQKNYSSAQTMLGQLSMIDHSIDALNNQGRGGLTATGTGANTKMALLKGLNSLSATFGGQAFIDPTKVASWEDLNKESTRMGFELAKTLGSREAQMIVQQAVSAVPNASNTYLGAKLVSASLRAAAQRQIDYYQYLNDFAMSHGGNTMGADIEFNKAHPVQDYTHNAIISGLGAKQAPDGKWYAPDPSRPGKYLEVNP